MSLFPVPAENDSENAALPEERKYQSRRVSVIDLKGAVEFGSLSALHMSGVRHSTVQ